MKIFYFLIFIVFPMSVGVVEAQTCKSLLRRSTSYLHADNFESHVKYLDTDWGRLPFVDVLPAPSRDKNEVIFLMAGFGKNMRSWIPHVNLLRKKGYRVVSLDFSNVGYHLKENGVTKLSRGKGLEHDFNLAQALMKKLNLKNVHLVGHSRGAWIAARLAVSFKRTKRLKSLQLFSPYVRYHWSSGLPGPWGVWVDQWWSHMLDQTSAWIGRKLGAALRDRENSGYREAEKIEGLSSQLEDEALALILKGTQPEVLSAEVSTTELINELPSQLPISVVTGGKDHELAPLSVVSELQIEGLNFTVEEDFNHFWPLLYPLHAVQVILESGSR